MQGLISEVNFWIASIHYALVLHIALSRIDEKYDLGSSYTKAFYAIDLNARYTQCVKVLYAPKYLATSP